MSVAVFLQCADSFKNKARYVFDTFFTYYKCKYKIYEDNESSKEDVFDTVIMYGLPDNAGKCDKKYKRCIIMYSDSAKDTFFDSRREYDEKSVQWIDSLPHLFGTKDGCMPDIIGSSFFFLSCWQEYVSDARDSLCRFPFRKSLQKKLDVCRRPLVNEYFELLYNKLREIGEKNIHKQKLPQGKRFIVALSHDIDSFSVNFKSKVIAIYQAIRAEKISNTLSIAGGFFKKPPYDVLHRMRQIESWYGFSSTFHFFKKYPGRAEKEFLAQVRELQGTPFEIGFHPSQESVYEETLSSEFEHYRKKVGEVCGQRVHALRFNIHHLFSQLEDMPVKYDNSIMFAETLGFRTAFAMPHLMYDIKNDLPFHTLEIPLHVMDTTLLDSRYKNFNDEETEREIIDFLAEGAKNSWCISLLIHNKFFWDRSKIKYAIYKRIMKFIKENNGLAMPGRDIYLWWNGIRAKNE